jgi:D-alanyl-D-alanine dipeptidase
MFQAVPDPNWVAKPSQFARSHESGLSVDVTITGVDMGTDFDDFTPRATAYATTGVTPAQQANRARLRDAMVAGGLSVYPGEWWHFNGPGAAEPRPILDVPVN